MLYEWRARVFEGSRLALIYLRFFFCITVSLYICLGCYCWWRCCCRCLLLCCRTYKIQRRGGNPDIQADMRTNGRTGRQSKGSTKPTSRRGRRRWRWSWDQMGWMVDMCYAIGMVWRHAYLKIIKQRQQQKETACKLLFRFAGECEIVKLFKVYAAY